MEHAGGRIGAPPGLGCVGQAASGSGGSQRRGNVNLTFAGYTYPVYDVARAKGLYPVQTRWATDLDGIVHAVERGLEAGRQQLTARQSCWMATGREWDLWQVAFDGRDRGGYERQPRSRQLLDPGDRLATVAGFRDPIPCHVGPGRPKSPAAISVTPCPCPSATPTDLPVVAPATKLERRTDMVGIPQGTRFALDVTDGEIEAWIAGLPEGPAGGDQAVGTCHRTRLARLWMVRHRHGRLGAPPVRGPPYRRSWPGRHWASTTWPVGPQGVPARPA